ncbi:MAG: hypothetical protein CL561_08665 [Alphaproteobacteria bacterium]|nr:hypothetical protein [Alphaproteobacteria bacterium]|tara:strand:- start:269078 stop:269785 length:708 start_codon:yes stop_codon:yes gene_type:complete
MKKINQQDHAAFTGYLSPVLTLWLPLFFVIMQFVIEVILPHDIAARSYDENGFLEITHTLIIFIALIFAGLSIAPTFKIGTAFLKFWIACAFLGCLYITGEEISWGQHIFGWSAGENWAQINDQQETNLHNTSSWLDQKPRLLVEIGIVVGGLIIPALIKWAPDKLPKQFWFIYPNKNYALTAAIFLTIKLTDRIGSEFGGSPFIRGSEVLEHFMFYFILLYVIDFRKRVLRATI